MKTQPNELWEPFRSSYRPQVPELDTAAIMDAVRREAAANPLRPMNPNPVAAIPAWVCAAAAVLALWMSVGVIRHSIELTDQIFVEAWRQEINPNQLEDALLSMTSFSVSKKGDEI